MKKKKSFVWVSVFCILFIMSMICVLEADAAQLYGAKGKLTLLRVHALGSGFGPPQDKIDVEVVIRLDSKPGESFGFQLRDNNDDTAVRRAMFDLLRDAFKNNWTVYIDYWMDAGKKNGIVHRVSLTK